MKVSVGGQGQGESQGAEGSPAQRSLVGDSEPDGPACWGLCSSSKRAAGGGEPGCSVPWVQLALCLPLLASPCQAWAEAGYMAVRCPQPRGPSCCGLNPHPACYPQSSWQAVAATVPDRCPSGLVPG